MNRTIYGLEQSNHGHLYRWIFTEESLLKQGIEPHDQDMEDISFPISGSNSSATYMIKLNTEEDIKCFLLSDYSTDYEDPMLIDIAEGIYTIDTDDDCYGAITSEYVKLFNISENDLTRENSLYDYVKELITEIEQCDTDKSSGIDYNNPFYGDSSDMRLSELEEIHDNFLDGILLEYEIGSGTYNIGFGGDDETQFDIENVVELKELWIDFCKENGFSVLSIDYIEKVEED